MQKSPVLPLLFLLCLFTGVGVYLMGSTSEGPDTELTLQDSDSEESGDTRYRGLMDGATEDSLKGADSEAEAGRTSVALTETPAELRASTSQAAITGRVVDTAGKGLGGARVTIGGSDPFPLLASLDSNNDIAKRWSTVSRTDGSFEVVGPEPGELRIGANLPGFVPAEVTNLVLPAGGGLDVGDVAMEIGVVLEGQVRVEGGRGVPGAELHMQDPNADFAWFGGNSGEPAATTDENGYFRIDTLAAGPWKIEVTSEAQPDRTFEGRTERPGDIQADLDFLLEPGFAISGHIAGASPKDLIGVEVNARPGTGGRGFRRPGGPEERKAQVAADGSYLVQGCREGEEYSLAGSLVDGGGNPFFGGPVVTDRVQGTAGDTGVNLPWIGNTGVQFEVVSAATGQPVEDFKVTFGRGWMQTFQRDSEPVVHHPTGKVSLTGLDTNDRGFRQGDFKVAIEATGYESFERELEIAEGETLFAGVFQLDPAALVTVTVLSVSTGLPVEGAEVRLSVGEQEAGGFMVAGFGRRGGQSDGESRSATTGADGVAQLSSFEGKTGRLAVTHDEHTPWRNDSFAMPAGAPVSTEARLGVGGTVVLTVLDALGNAKPGARVATQRPPADGGGAGLPSGGRRMGAAFGGGNDGTVVADSNGIATFYHLEPGTHEFKIAESTGGSGFMIELGGAGGGDDWLAVDVTEGGREEATLREDPTCALDGTVTENGIGLAGAELSLVATDDPMGGFNFGNMGGPGNGDTDGHGKYSLSGVKPGSYNLEISHAGRVMKSRFPVELVAGENHFDAALSISVVEGHITDDKGQALAGVKVRVARADAGRQTQFMMIMDNGGDAAVQVGNGGPDPSVTDADGFYSLRGVETGVELQVSATTDTSSPSKTEPFTMGEGETKSRTDLVLNPAGILVFEVSGGEDGFYFVTATYLDDTSLQPKPEFSQTRKGTITGLKPGKWSVTVQNVGPNAGDGSSDPIEVVIDAGKETEVVLEI